MTGAEALYAAYGAFGLKPISTLVCLRFALVLNYFGPRALILLDPTAGSKPLLSLRSRVGALSVNWLGDTSNGDLPRKAVISGAFSVTRQAMQLGFVPRMEVLHTSEQEQGQIYLPAVNWGLMVAVMILVVGFKSSNNLAAAYGIAVTGDMVITSMLATVVVAKVWGWGWTKPACYFLSFLSVELIFLAANIMRKFQMAAGSLLVAGMFILF